MSVRALLKKAAERVLANEGLLKVATRPGRQLVLAYHNVVPRGERAAGDSSLHMAQSEFARQLDLLLELYDLVPLQEIFADAGDRPRAAVTFDDAYKGVFTAGREELERRGVRAAVFVAPAFIGGRPFWWDQLASSGEGTLPTAVRNHALGNLAGRHEAIVSWAQAEGITLQELPRHARAADEGDLACDLFDYGVHTWSHPSLPHVHGEELAAELRRPREWLLSRTGSMLPWITYPYGHHSAEAERVAERLGYEGGFLIDGGRMPERLRNYGRMPRFNVPAGISDRGFLLRAAGLVRS